VKKALITGVSGQDGSYLAEQLLAEGYAVHGVVRRSSLFNRERLDPFYHGADGHPDRFFLHYGDMSDSITLRRLMEQIRPDEIYNLAAQSHVQISFEMPEYTTDVDAVGALRLLSAIREVCPQARYYQASTSELFGLVKESPQNEETAFHPRSPYGVAKLYAYWMTIHYREAYGLHAGNGILFNHESPRRGENFVTRKISRTAALIAEGAETCLTIGNMNVSRDWGYAPDYVRAMRLMLQQDLPDDYVIATGEAHTVREFIETAFSAVDIALEWQGAGPEEIGVCHRSGRTLVRVDPRFYRLTEVMAVVGDAAKARRVLGWEPQVRFDELVQIMVESDRDLIRNARR